MILPDIRTFNALTEETEKLKEQMKKVKEQMKEVKERCGLELEETEDYSGVEETDSEED